MSKISTYISFFLSGLAFGIANVIPGVSGGTMLVVFGIYDKLTEAISGIKSIFKNFGFLLAFALGAGVGIIGFAFIITWLFESFGVQTNMYFIGLVLGSIPLIVRTATATEKIKPMCILPFLIGFAAVIGLAVLENTRTTEQYTLTVQSEVTNVRFEQGTITINNNSSREIKNWSIELADGMSFDPKAASENADFIIHNSFSHQLQELFGKDLPENHNMIVSIDGTEIPPESEFSFTYTNYNSTPFTAEDMTLNVSYKVDVMFFFTMLAALFIAAMVMIIPGVSGSFVMMLLGVYTTVIAAIKDIDLMIIIPCAIGAILGIMLGAKLISSLIKKHSLMMYSGIMGLVIGSVYAIIPAGFGFNLSTGYGFVAMIAGILTSVSIDKLGKSNEE